MSIIVIQTSGNRPRTKNETSAVHSISMITTTFEFKVPKGVILESKLYGFVGDKKEPTYDYQDAVESGQADFQNHRIDVARFKLESDSWGPHAATYVSDSEQQITADVPDSKMTLFRVSSTHENTYEKQRYIFAIIPAAGNGVRRRARVLTHTHGNFEYISAGVRNTHEMTWMELGQDDTMIQVVNIGKEREPYDARENTWFPQVYDSDNDGELKFILNTEEINAIKAKISDSMKHREAQHAQQP